MTDPLTLDNAPIGTRAPATTGGHWHRVKHGWRWGKRGGVFPRPGGDWTGELLAPGVQNTWERIMGIAPEQVID